jgi:DNA-binding NarL/FixJ family response regulator
LLVDDHLAVRSGLRLLLEKSNFIVHESSDGASAAQILTQTQIHLALVDSQLEREDGIEIAASLRKNNPALRIAMLSMHSQPEKVRRAVRAGVNGYLLKHAEAEEMLAAARLLLYGGFYLDARVADVFLEAFRETRSNRAETHSERKQILIESLKQNQSNQDMAQRLNLSVSSIKAHLRELYEEQGVKDRTGLLLKLSQNRQP